MSYSDAMRYANEVERGVEMEIYRREMEQQEYEEEMEELKEEILDSFHSFKERDYNNYRDWETDRKSTRLNSSHSGESRMPSSA